MFHRLIPVRLVAFLLLLWTGCQKEFSAPVLIKGIGSDVKKLRVYVWRDRQLRPERHFDAEELQNNTEFKINVPVEEHTREIELIILGLTSGDIMAYHGYAIYDVPSANSDPPQIELHKIESFPNQGDFSCWNPKNSSSTGCGSPLIHSSDSNVFWKLDQYILSRTLDNYSWSVLQRTDTAFTNLDSLGANYAAIVSQNGIAIQCDGRTCSEWLTPPNTSLCGVRILEKGVAYVSGRDTSAKEEKSGLILKCYENKCERHTITGSPPLCGLIADTNDNLRAVGNMGTILRCKNKQCNTDERLTEEDLNAMWGPDTDHFWVAGNGGIVLRCEGLSCVKVQSRTKNNLKGVWGSSFDSVFVVGDKGTILTCTKDGCSESTGSKTTSDLASIHGSSPTNVIASGSDNTKLTWNGREWQQIQRAPFTLTVSGNGLMVTFSPSTEVSTLTIPRGISEIQVRGAVAAAESTSLRLKINQNEVAWDVASDPIAINFGIVAIPVSVVSEFGDSEVIIRRHTIVVTRPLSDYLKASNTEQHDFFGTSVSLDGDTLAVGAPGEDSRAVGVNGGQSDNTAQQSGAVYVFVRKNGFWQQQAYLKASYSKEEAFFGKSVSLSGNTLAVGAFGENSKAKGVDGDETNTDASNSGAVYVFVRSGATWTQQAYLKASNTGNNDQFGGALSLSRDTLAVGATSEDSKATGVNGDQSDNTSVDSGAVYVFARSGTTWTQQAYLKASNTGNNDQFGGALSLSGDTLAVGATSEDSKATGVNGDQADNTANDSGAVYIFVRSGTTWTQQAYLKASNTGNTDQFGGAVSLFGETLAIGAPGEASEATGVNGDQSDNTSVDSGAVYVFVRTGTTWTQQAYLKASNTGTGDSFGRSLSLFNDKLVVGANGEASSAVDSNNNETDDSAKASGAVYVFARGYGAWQQVDYLKASNTDSGDQFGFCVSLSNDDLSVGARHEQSRATGVNGDKTDNGANSSGAVYVLTSEREFVGTFL